MKKTLITLATVAVTTLVTNAQTVNQTVWTTGGSQGSVYDPISASNITFTFSGSAGLGRQGGDPIGTVGINTFGMDNNDYVGDVSPTVSQTHSFGTYTFNFASSITNPILQVFSLGNASGPVKPVTLDFGTNSFSSLSDNGNFTVSGNTLLGLEVSGSIQFNGAFNSLSFTATQFPEDFTGFSIATVNPVPEPSGGVIFCL